MKINTSIIYQQTLLTKKNIGKYPSIRNIILSSNNFVNALKKHLKDKTNVN